ncbi:MAG: radical SAM protein [Candidatus Omnitrophota bacterium]
MERDYLPFPFFLAYAASLLQKNGKKVFLIDAIAEDMTHRDFLDKISGMGVDYLVAETSVPSFPEDLALLEQISEMGISLILCGPNAQMYEPPFLIDHSFIDFVLCGEYEGTLLELADCLENGRELSGVKGLVFRNDGQIIKNQDRDLLDVNSLPWPHRETLPMEKYLDAPGGMPTPSAQMVASRGCPFGCGFCLWPQVMYRGQRYRPRAVKDVIDEMEYLVKEKGFKSVYFDDDTFNIDKSRMLEFCDQIIERHMEKIPWAIMARPDLMDKDILLSMKSAGLWAVKYGMESADQDLLDEIGKSMDLKKAIDMVALTKELGIKVHLTFTFGLPGETLKTIAKTISLVKKLDPFSAQFSITTPFPGTKYYDILEKNGGIVSKDFKDYDGYSKSVIRLSSLLPEDLEEARQRACRAWEAHIRRRRGLLNSAKRFFYYVKEKGWNHAVKKSVGYLLRAKLRIPAGHTWRIQKAKADILLVQCPPWDVSMPPLGIAYLKGYLEKYGYKPTVCDLNIALHNHASDDSKFLWEQKSFDWWVDEEMFKKTEARLKTIANDYLKDVLGRLDAPVIGLSTSFTSIRFTSVVLKIIKALRKDAKIVLGGWGCVNEHMRGLFPGELVDCFVVGEGEETLKEVLEAFNGRRKKQDIPGAIFKNDDSSLLRPRPAIADLNSIPWPTFSGFDLSRYKHPIIPLMTSRGCIGNCSFCNDWPLSKPYRFYNAVNIFEQIKYHIDNNHRNVFSFKDLLCNGNLKELNDLADIIIKEGLRIGWDSQAIAYQGMSFELLRKLKKTGCGTLIYGIESFSNNVLKKMKKMFTRQIAEQVIRDTYHAGIRVTINLIVGFPSETEEDFNETLEAIKRNRKYIFQVGAVSVCLVNNDAELDQRPGDYGIVLPGDLRIRAKKWSTTDRKNTYEMRRERADRVITLLRELGLSYDTQTI